MRKLPIAVLLAALATAAPAAAKEDEEIEVVPGVVQLQGGATQDLRVTLVRFRDGAVAPVRGVRPILALQNVSTQRRIEAVGTPTDARGHSGIRVHVPATGRWRPQLLAGPRFWDYPVLDFGAAPARATPRPADSGFPWLPVAAGGALLVLLLGALGRRHHRPRRVAME
jgi:hypothetical protein